MLKPKLWRGRQTSLPSILPSLLFVLPPLFIPFPFPALLSPSRHCCYPSPPLFSLFRSSPLPFTPLPSPARAFGERRNCPVGSWVRTHFGLFWVLKARLVTADLDSLLLVLVFVCSKHTGTALAWYVLEVAQCPSARAKSFPSGVELYRYHFFNFDTISIRYLQNIAISISILSK